MQCILGTETQLSSCDQWPGELSWGWVCLEIAKYSVALPITTTHIHHIVFVVNVINDIRLKGLFTSKVYDRSYSSVNPNLREQG